MQEACQQTLVVHKSHSPNSHTVTKLQDKLPLLQNFGAFLLAAAFVRQSPLFKPSAKDLDLISKEGQKKQDAKDFSED